MMETSDDIWTSIKAVFYSCVMDMAVFMCCIRIKWNPLWWRTVFHRASWRSLMRLNPVVKMFPSAKKMALIGRAPSWALSFSWKQKQHLSDWAAMFVGSFRERLLHTRSIQAPNPCASASTYRDNLLFTGVDDADLLVLAGGAEQAAVAAPADTKDNIRVHVLQVDHGLSRAHVPNDNLVVTP